MSQLLFIYRPSTTIVSLLSAWDWDYSQVKRYPADCRPGLPIARFTNTAFRQGSTDHVSLSAVSWCVFTVCRVSPCANETFVVFNQHLDNITMPSSSSTGKYKGPPFAIPLMDHMDLAW